MIVMNQKVRLIKLQKEISLKEWEGSGGSGVRWVNREEFDADLEPIMPYAYGTINYAYIERWVEYNSKEHRIIPDDEIWSQKTDL